MIKTAISKRDALVEYLNNIGIESRVYYPIPLHLQECYKSLGCKAGDFLNSEAASASVAALPVYPELKREDVLRVAEAVSSFV